MSETLRKWLKKHIDGLPNVRRCTLGQNVGVSDPVRKADLVVHTWAGIDVHIHLLDTPISVRTIRRIVEDATRVGVSTLFLVDLKLLPADGERIPADKWYVAIHALIDTRLYAFQLGAREPVIRQVHFQHLGRAPEVETRYGPHIAITQLRWFRNSVKSNLIKGYWMVADFGPDVTKKTPEPQTRAWADYQRARQTYSQAPGEQQPASHDYPRQEQASEQRQQPPATGQTRLELCYQLLCVQRSATRDEVKAAFRRLAFELHPDVSDLPKDQAEERFKALNEAYEYIKLTQGWS